MEQEFDSTKHENKVDDSREGYQKPSYTKEYSSEGRPQRQRIRTPIRSAYPSDRQRYNSDREAGAFRPEGFGGGLAADGDHRQQYPQRPRYNNNYGDRQQGYRPRYNNDGEGYSPRQQQGYRPRYNNNSEGNGQQSGGYNRGGYNQQRGGYGQ
ncbi:MAG: pseudouridine synthase, partial [bacterium]|nr:pseudouridine synthase [bacterium]